MRRLLAVVVAAAGVLGATLTAFAVGVVWPAANESARESTRLVVFALVGGLSGSVTAGWLRPEGSTTHRLTAVLVLAGAFAVGAGIGGRLEPLGGSLRQRGGLGTYPVFFTAALGALVVAQLAAPAPSFGGRAAPGHRSASPPGRPASPPLTPDERATVERALAVLDRLQRFHARVVDGRSAPPDESETERFFDDGEEYRRHWEGLPASHPVTTSLRVAGETLTTAVEMRFVAHGWHQLIAVEPGDAEGVALAQRTWDLAASAPNDIADALVRRARTARDEIDAFRANDPPSA